MFVNTHFGVIGVAVVVVCCWMAKNNNVAGDGGSDAVDDNDGNRRLGNTYNSGENSGGKSEQGSSISEQQYKKISEQQENDGEAAVSGNSATTNTGNKAKNDQQQTVLLCLKFPQDFPVFNPRKNDSLFTWSTQSGETDAGDCAKRLSDNAAFQLISGTKNNDAYGSSSSSSSGGSKTSNEYGNNAAEEGKSKTAGYSTESGYLRLSTLPFSNQFYQEGYVATKQNYQAAPNDRIIGRMKMSCKIVNAEQNPFNATEVSHPDDDPRLASCQFEMCNQNGTRPGFFFLVINKSIWAVYFGVAFQVKRKVAVRKRYDSIEDLALELDRRQSVVNYYLNGKKVWTVPSNGTLPPTDGVNVINVGQTNMLSLTYTITAVEFSFGTGKCPDETDPYQPNNPNRLIRILPANNPYYNATTMFYDPNATYNNIDFGQGAVMDIYKMVVQKII